MSHPTPHLINLLALSSLEVTALVQDLGWPRYRSHQILTWLYQHRVLDIEAMTNLSKADRATLQRVATVQRELSAPPKVAADGTGKFLLALEDGLAVETVLIPEGRRRTVCLSSQVGCTLDCGFCLTAEMGLKRNLRAHEIVGQVLNVQAYLSEKEHVTSLVFMGMGEPLVNFEPVAEAIQRLTNMDWGMGFSPRRITVSTARAETVTPRLRARARSRVWSRSSTSNVTRTGSRSSGLRPDPGLQPPCCPFFTAMPVRVSSASWFVKA